MHVRAVALALMAAAGLSAQAPAPQQPPPIFRTGAELVRVDVTVIDGRGRPVTDLTAADFVVEEDGIPQTIQSFKLLELDGHPLPGDDVSLTIGSMAHGNTEVAREDVRVFVVFWDEYHLLPFPDARRMREALVTFFRTMLGPSDLVAVMDPWTPMSHLRFTRDVGALDVEISRLQGRQGVLIPPRNGAEENHLQFPTKVPMFRAQVAASALQSAMMHLGALRDSRKSIIYVAREFAGGTQDMQDLIRTAREANVVLYSVSPEGLRVQGSNFRTGFLAAIAHNSGGESFVTNDPRAAFKRVVTQASAYYLLGYSPSSPRHDGKFHRIHVRVKRSGVEVKARSGYWAPDVATMTRAKRLAAESVLPPGVEAAFAQLVRLGRDTDGPAVVPRTILVPDPPAPELQVVTTGVWRVQRPADLKAALSEAPSARHEGRAFTSGDRLIIRFRVDGTAAGAATVAAGLVDRRGKRLTDLPLRAEQAAWLIDLPLTSIARGDYLIGVEAASGVQRSTAYVPIRVTGR
jgi:VWFA-related protein